MNELTKEFIKFAKEKYDCDIVLEPSDDPDTFEKIFGVSFVSTQDKETLEYIKEEFDRPIKSLYSAAVILCLALHLNDNGCKNCPVTLFDYDKRTEYEKCCLHEPCQTNLYKWLKDEAVEEKECLKCCY